MRLRSIVLVVWGGVAALYIGSTGKIPGTPAAAWRERIDALESTVAILQHARHVRDNDGIAVNTALMGKDVTNAVNVGARGVSMMRMLRGGDSEGTVGGASACGSPTLVIGVLTKVDAKGAGLRRVSCLSAIYTLIARSFGVLCVCVCVCVCV